MISGKLHRLIVRIIFITGSVSVWVLFGFLLLNLLHHHYGFYGINPLILALPLVGTFLSIGILFYLLIYKQSLRSSFVGSKGIVKHVFRKGQVRIVVEGYAYVAIPQEPVSKGDTVEIVAVDSSLHSDLKVRKV
ncbi:MAG: hypothetical protein KIY09_01785 [Thermoplasmata archaeon]|nr:hypothetical protein [Candidatus Sysuiplasma acidicola]